RRQGSSQWSLSLFSSALHRRFGDARPASGSVGKRSDSGKVARQVPEQNQKPRAFGAGPRMSVQTTSAGPKSGWVILAQVARQVIAPDANLSTALERVLKS